ncbi:MAG: helix-turn-helix transcriptional regulator [Solirubrobacteraceae bacterium]
MPGEADIAKVAALIADPARARILLALGDGRALPATVLASEAGVAASTTSAHLGKLVDGGLLTVRRQGRHRYFELAGPAVGEALEKLMMLAPAAPVRSLRQGTRANAIRSARTCYDHLAGMLGAGMMAAMLERELLAGGDGTFTPDEGDRLSGPGHACDYVLTDYGRSELTAFGIELDALARQRRPLIRYCVDWSEQRHHLAGALGAAIAQRTLELGWITRAKTGRAVRVTPAGRDGLADVFGLTIAA